MSPPTNPPPAPAGDGRGGGTSALTEGQRRFCEHYAADPNGTQAYRRSRPHVTYHTARREAARLLTDPAILAEIAAARDAYRKSVRVNARRVLRELAAAGFFDWADVLEADDACNGGLPRPKRWADVPPAARRALTAVKIRRKRIASTVKDDATCWEVEDIEFKGPDKLAALDKLCKHLGLLGDQNAVAELLGELASAKKVGAS